MKKRNFFFAMSLVLPAVAILLSFVPQQDKNNPGFQNIIQKFENYFSRLPQQKVYLQLDKNSYKADETVWFKAYLVEAQSHRPDGNSKNLYVNLINPSGYIVQRKLIRMTNGFGNGDFSFQDTIPEGIYKIRAFTSWMQNLKDDFFFEKDIYIANPAFSTYITREELHVIKKNLRKSKKAEAHFDVQFLPEGGHLLAGVSNRIGFKALNDLGQGTKVNGEILDSKGKSITSFESSEYGMGSVMFTPLPNQHYTAVVNFGEDDPLKVKIPEAIDIGVNISVSRIGEDKSRIGLLTNIPVGEFPPNTNYYLLGHVRGKILLTHEFDLKNQNNSIDISTSEFPSGILHLTLFNAFSQPVSERLIFIKNNDELKIHINNDKLLASSREKITVNLKITDFKDMPVNGNFSLSIANAENSTSSENILSYLLLNSDLSGKVENPKYYFENWNSEKEKQLDDLMLTQGWRRFSWTRVLSDLKIFPKYENENGIIITGNITRQFFNIPLRDIKVTLNVLNEYNDVFTTRSGAKGVFRFENLDYRDTMTVSVEAVRSNGKPNLLIYVDEQSNAKDKEMRYQTNLDAKRRGEKGRYTEPVNTEEEDPFFKENNRIYRLHEEPSASNVIIIDEQNQGYQSIGQILDGRIPGVMVTGNKVIIRGIGTLYGSTDPLFLVDGMMVDPDYAMNMNPYDVERIEVLKGPETAIYGSRGGNGVIAIYTKRGKFVKRGILEFKMLGYATPKEYYKPGIEYRTDDPFEDDRRTILWMPYVTANSSGETSLTFFSSDVKGKYIIKIEGLSNEGIPGIAESGFEVR